MPEGSRKNLTNQRPGPLGPYPALSTCAHVNRRIQTSGTAGQENAELVPWLQSREHEVVTGRVQERLFSWVNTLRELQGQSRT